MAWPSTNVPQGGIFHPTKISYSPETKDFLKLLMDESHMSNKLRNQVNYTLRNGTPFPKFKSDTPPSYRKAIPEPPILIRSGNWGKRRKETIVESGAYDIPPFVPDRSKEDREKAKERLQFIMANGKPDIRESKFVHKREIPTPKPFNKFDQIAEEIRERQEWLAEMEELGEAHKHRDLINMQIEAKLKELEDMKFEESTESKNGEGQS